MPVTFRLARDHYGLEQLSSNTHYVALSGQMIIGDVGREVFSDQRTAFRWSIRLVTASPVNGLCDTPEEAKAALQRAWFSWVERAGLRDNPEAAPYAPVKDRG